MEKKENDSLMFEKGFSRIKELKIKIKDDKYIQHAIEKIANQICQVFF